VGVRRPDKIQRFKNTLSKYKILSLAVLLLIQLAIPFIHISTALASPTISSFPTTGRPGAMTVAGGDTFYLQGTAINSVGRMTTSGTKTDYAMGLPSGATSFTVKPQLITGPDGNVWFFGSTNLGLRLGKLDISSGSFTYYTLPCSDSAANIGTGPDDKIYFSCSTPGATGAAYLKSFDLSTAATSVFWTFQPYSAIGNIFTGTDGRLYVTDGYHKHIFGFNVGTSGGVNFSTGTTSATDLTSGPDGNLWFVRHTNKIVKATTAGVLTEYSLPSGITVDSETKLAAGPDGAMWFYNAGTTTSGNVKVGRITTSGIVTSYTLPITGTLHYIYGGPVVGSDGAIWVNYSATGYGNGLMKLTTNPSFTQFPITSTNTQPGFMTVADSKIWYLYNNSPASIGSMTTSGVTTDYPIGAPSGTTGFTVKKLITGSDGNVWFYGSATPGYHLGKLSTSTGTVTYYSLPCAAIDIGAGPDNKIYFSCSTPGATGAGYLNSFDISAETTSTFWTFQPYSVIGNIMTGGDGKLYVTDGYHKWIFGFNIGSTGGVSFSSGPTSASNLTYGSDGNLWFVRPGNKVVKATPAGVLTEYDTSSSMVVDTSTELAAGSDGAVYIYNIGYYGDRKVGRITTSGVLTTYQLPVTETLSYDRGGPLLGPDGAIWVTYYVDGATQGLMRLGH
jgi:virginiamycin B lyase